MTFRSLTALDRHKTGGFPAGYPTTVRTFWAPIDDVHGALIDLIGSARSTLQLGMFAFTDPALWAAILARCADPAVAVQISLDADQAVRDTAEAALLAGKPFPATSVAVGTSEKHNLMHLKLVVVDGAVTATGSTNWTGAGERLEDNALVVINNRAVAADAGVRLDAIHARMLAASG